MPHEEFGISDWFDAEIKSKEPELRAYLRKIAPDNVDIDDILQEVYQRVIVIRQQRKIFSASGLVFSIAKNVVNDLLRKKYRANTISLAEMDVLHDVDTVPLPEQLAEKSDDYAMLKEAIQSLPKKCRTIFVLRNFEKLSHKDIARRLGISVHTVEAQLTIGIRKCRKFFKSRGIIG